MTRGISSAGSAQRRVHVVDSDDQEHAMKSKTLAFALALALPPAAGAATLEMRI